jgi:hypothetical protein
MTVFQKVQSWITQDKQSSFSPLDENGYSSFTPAAGGVVYLFASPEEEGAALLYAPLVSLQGTDPAAQLDFLWDLAEANIVGAVPSTYRFFADREDETIYLGCQFETGTMDYTGFFALLDAFVRYVGVERGRMRAELDAMAGEETEEASVVPAPAANVRPPAFPFAPGILRG